MVYITPPQLSNGSRLSYAETYSKILSKYRSSPLTSAAAVVLLVAPDVDALCAARMLSDMLNQDDVIHRIIPVSGFSELEEQRNQLSQSTELHTLILLNIGGLLDLTHEEWFGSFNSNLNVHVIDSLRPLNLECLFMDGEQGERIVVWDDGSAEKLKEEGKSWEFLAYDPAPDSDEENSEDDFEDSDMEDMYRSDEEDYEQDSDSGKRRLADGQEGGRPKRRRLHRGRASREERRNHEARINKYYRSGTYHAQSAAGTVYALATMLERVDNDLLWFAILGLTYQYTTSRISRDVYEKYQSAFADEVARLNAPSDESQSITSFNPDDNGIRATDELRFMLFRHWTLYDAMYHSSYIGSRLGIWKERGRKRLTGLLAKMGFSIIQTQQPYPHMDMDLKRDLVQKLTEVAPEYGLVELVYPSFMRCYGYQSQPLSAADAVEAINALLDVAGGVKMEVETEGARNGGEWFGTGKVWQVNSGREVTGKKRADGEHTQNRSAEGAEKPSEDGKEATQTVQWWVKNFWTAFDALDEISSLREALPLSMSLHRAIIRQGTSVIDKHDIRTMSNYRVVVLSQGPDLALFSHPSVLTRLALWLVDALRDRVPAGTEAAKKSRKSLPFVVACLKETTDTYMVVGITAAMDFGDVRKNEFGLSFLAAKEQCNIITQHTSLDASVLEIEKDGLKTFLNALVEGPDL